VDAERQLAALEHIEADLSDVEHALRRLDDGTYGVCEACGGQISEARHRAHPAARTCRDDHGETWPG